jgi:hypothetical protein
MLKEGFEAKYVAMPGVLSINTHNTHVTGQCGAMRGKSPEINILARLFWFFRQISSLG